MTAERILIRIPGNTPVSVNEDAGKLLVTIPPYSPLESVHAVDKVARTLLKDREVELFIRTIETDFLIKQLRDRPENVWAGLVLINYAMPKDSPYQMTHTLDMPGPIHIKPMEQVDGGLVVKAWYKT
jgi:hypothetical protein